MTKARFVVIVGVSIAASFLAGYLYNHKAPEAQPSSPANRAVLYYRDPMHPSYTSDKPGKAPDCGMALEPVYAEGQGSAPGVMHVSSERQQTIGVRLGRVEKSPATLTFRALGRVAADEARVFPLITGADGWVRQIFPRATGSMVQKGQPLVTVYGREYMTTQRAYLYALRGMETAPQVPAGDFQDKPGFALEEARLNLQNLGFEKAQIQQLAETRQVLLDVTLTAPAAGIIVARNVFPQQRFERGAELFRIADLSSVWIVADLSGDEAQYVHGGATAKVTLPDRPGTVFHATVTKTLPRFDAAARTLKVRLETANRALTLWPDMFVDLEFLVSLPATATVPADAVLESGLKKTVFVVKGPGLFEPRTVETGWRFSDRVQILRGLEPGESIVVSGNFLLDSESRIQQGGAQGHD